MAKLNERLINKWLVFGLVIYLLVGFSICVLVWHSTGYYLEYSDETRGK